jgi:hypothetical protein
MTSLRIVEDLEIVEEIGARPHAGCPADMDGRYRRDRQLDVEATCYTDGIPVEVIAAWIPRGSDHRPPLLRRCPLPRIQHHRQYGLAAYPSRGDRFSKTSPPTSKPPACRDASAVPTAPAWLQRAGLGADVMGTGASSGERWSEGGER